MWWESSGDRSVGGGGSLIATVCLFVESFVVFCLGFLCLARMGSYGAKSGERLMGSVRCRWWMRWVDWMVRGWIGRRICWCIRGPGSIICGRASRASSERLCRALCWRGRGEVVICGVFGWFRGLESVGFNGVYVGLGRADWLSHFRGLQNVCRSAVTRWETNRDKAEMAPSHMSIHVSIALLTTEPSPTAASYKSYKVP